MWQHLLLTIGALTPVDFKYEVVIILQGIKLGLFTATSTTVSTPACPLSGSR